MHLPEGAYEAGLHLQPRRHCRMRRRLQALPALQGMLSQCVGPLISSEVCLGLQSNQQHFTRQQTPTRRRSTASDWQSMSWTQCKVHAHTLVLLEAGKKGGQCRVGLSAPEGDPQTA